MKKVYLLSNSLKRIAITVLLFIFSSLTFQLKATHIVGGVLTYVYNGGSSYTVTLKLYRDCNGNALPGSVTINVAGYNGLAFSPSKDFTINLTSSSFLPSNLDSCAEAPSPMPCVQEGIYTATVTNLSPNAGGYHLAYDICCRNLTTTNVDCSCNCIGETFYAYIPGYTPVWFEDFPTNGQTSDAGTTAWTRTLGTTAPGYAQTVGNLFEVQGANNGEMTWLSQQINISTYTSGVNLFADLSESGNMDANDSIIIYYSINSGPFVQFATNGVFANDFTSATASTGPITGNTVQIRVRVHYDGNSPTSELYRFDNVWVVADDFVSNDNPVFTNFPPLFLCQGTSFTFDHSATDTDGDSLAYSFYNPYTDDPITYSSNVAQFTSVIYQGAYTYLLPLGAGSLTLDPLTGIITGSPTTVGQFIVGIKVKEYRNGVLMSEMVRDFQFNVVNCPAPAQALIIPGDAIDACGGNSVTFPNNSDATADNWTWDFGDLSTTADVSTLEFPSYTYPSPGTYNATLIINAGTSCADTSTASVDVGFATATFTNNSPVCAGQTVTFTTTPNLSSNAGTVTYDWDFGDGNTSTLQNPTHVYATGGTYTATLIVGSTLGCGDTITASITINAAPAAPTAGSNSPLCEGQTLNLTASTISGATYSWTGPNSFSSTTQNPSITNITSAGAGVYSVTATVAGCPGPAGTVTVTVNPLPAAPTAGSNSPVCEGSTLNLTASTITSATYFWTGPNSFTSTSQNPSVSNVIAANAGTYSVTATVSGCAGSAGTVSVVVNPIPTTPTPTSNSPLCIGQTINLSTTAVTGATYSWTGPNSFSSSAQNPSITNAQLADAGTYSLTVTVNGCTSSAGTVAVVVNAAPSTPVAGSNSPICAGQNINLTASLISGATYSWTGPNGFTSTLQNPTVTSATTAAAGTYTVTANNGCASSPATTTVVVNPTPVAPTAGSNSPLCVGATLNLTASTITSATYSWTGPNGFSSTSQNPSVTNITSADAGVYSVTATVGGCTGPAGTVTVVVNPIPAAPTAGSNSPVCQGQSINLTSTTVTGATYSWTGPSAFSSSLQNPTRPSSTVAMSGTYSLTATVAGCTSSASTVNVTVNPTPATPTAGSNSPVCSGQTLNLTSSTVGSSTYSWTGPNSFTSTSQNPSITGVTTAASGIYTVIATENGCPSASATTTVVVNATPATPAPTSNSPLCIGQTLNLSTTAVTGATYSWTGPNSFSSSAQNPSVSNVQLVDGGTYSLTVTVNGCTSIAGTVVVTVNATPSTPVAGSNSPICAGQNINLTASLISGATYSWTGPNGFTSTLQNPTVTSATTAAAGTYTVTANNGCASSPATTTVVVNPTPVAPTAGSNSPLCVGATLNLTASTITSATYSWTGPNGFSSTSQNPSVTNITSADAGVYSVTATVGGCTGPAGTVTVVVNPIPTAPTAGSNSPVCEGQTLVLTSSTVSGASYSWTGPNSFTSTTQNPSIANVTLAADGVYSVTATVSGCTSSAGTVTVTINPTPSAPTATNNGPLCEGATLDLTATNVTGATYSWTGPNGFSSTTQNPSITNTTIAEDGVYSVTVTVGGCTSVAATTTAVINAIPTAPVISSNSPICVGQNLNLTSNLVSGATYSWTGPNGFSSSLQNPTITGATAAATGTYDLTITVNGCTSSVSSLSATVNSTPVTPVASSNSPVCEGYSLNLIADTIPGAVYSWTGPNGFTSSQQNPTITGVTSAAAGTYTVIANNGCSSAPATTTVVINPTPANPIAGSNSPVCIGSTINLTSNLVASATYDWSGPNSYSSSQQNPTILIAQPTDAGMYYVTVTVSGCTSFPDSVSVIVNQPAIADAGTDQTVCGNNNLVSLGGTVTGGSSTGVWSTSGTGTFTPSSSDLNATYNPSSADTTTGSVTLTLTTTGTPGCTDDVASILITITDAPVADAGTDQSVCSNNATAVLNGTITDASGGIWTTNGSGTFSPSDTDLNATYTATPADTAAGSIMVYLTSTGNGSCLAVMDSMQITFTPSPVVNAGPDQFVCLSSPNALLNGTITGGSSTGTWTTSGTGTFNPDANTLGATYIPSNADTTAGSVTLTLTSTNNGNCNAVTDQMTITYTTVPIVDAGSDQTVCGNNAATVLSGSIIGGGGAGIWSSNGTGTFTPSDTDLNATYNPSTADTTAGSVILTLTSTTGCSVVTDQITITITDGPLANAGADISVCQNNPDATLNGTVSGATTTGDWSTSGTGTFSNGVSSLSNTYVPSGTDVSSGSVTLFLTSTGNGTCVPDIDTLVITYTPPPIADAGSDTSICANTPIQLNGTISGGNGTGIWTTSGTGTFSASANDLNAFYIASTADTTAGSVQLTLTSTNNGGCIPSSETITLTLTDAPIVDAGADQNLCANNPVVTLNGSVTVASGGMWSTLGGGTFTDEFLLSTDYTPDTSDINSGSVTLVLTSTGNGTCTPVNDTILINFFPAPIVDAGADLFICTGTMVATLNGNVSGVTTTGNWTTLGSGTFNPSSTNLNADYDLSAADTTAGSITLVLESTNNNGCLAVTDTVLITITTIPTVSAGNDTTVCGNNSNIVLSGSVIGGGGTGDWTTSGTGTFNPSASTLNATYIPSSADTLAGSVTLTLTATNSCIPVTDDMIITFTTAPTVDAGPDQSFCASQNTVSLNGTINSVPSGAIWSTNGAGTFSSSTTTLVNTYTIAASDSALSPLQFYLTSFGSGDCIEIIDTLNINISGFPNAEFVLTNGCENQDAQFTDASTVSPGNVTGWMWDFGNGDTSTIQNPTNVYSTTGDYTVTLIVETSGGCMDTVSHLIHINATPNADFNFVDGCFTDILFTDNSSIASGSITDYDWDFGDGNTSIIPSPNNIYADTGSYSVTLTVTSDSLCSNTSTQIVNIIPQPIAGFTMNAVCGTTVVNFSDTSLVIGDSIVDWNWTFTNGTGNNAPNVSNDFTVFGPATATLIVTSSSGCSDTATVSFTLNDNPIADFTPTGGSYNVNENIDFFGMPNDMLSWDWDFGDSLGTAAIQNPSYAYGQSGDYIVILTVTDSLGCSDTASYVFNIAGGNVGVPGAFTPNGDGVNDILYVRGGPLTELSFTIFNEWGNKIFFTDDQSVGWDGRYKSKPQAGGVYVYILKATSVTGEEIDITGHVTLIR